MSLRVGITGTGSLVGQAIIKSLRLSEFIDSLSLVGFDYFEQTVGSFWVEKNYLLPDIFKEDVSQEEWLEALRRLITAEGLGVLFIGVDFELPILARHRQDIERDTGCRIMVSSPDVIETADDKFRTYEFLRDNDFACPVTLLPGRDSLERVSYPCVLKPRRGYRSRNVWVVGSPEELQQKLPLVQDPVVQELIGTPEKEYTCGTLSLNGEVRDSIVLRRTLKEGNTFMAFHDRDTPPAIGEYVRRVASKLSPNGTCNFQLRLGSDGIPRIFEINARHSGTTFMRALFGFNEVDHIVRHVQGLPSVPFEPRYGRVIRFYEEEYLGE